MAKKKTFGAPENKMDQPQTEDKVKIIDDLVDVEMLFDSFGCDLINGKPGPRKLFKRGSTPRLCRSVARTFLANNACKLIKDSRDEIKNSNSSDEGTYISS